MKYKYFNGPLILARYEAVSLMCNGYCFNTKNKRLAKWFKQFESFNKLQDLIYSIIENNSLNGRSIVGLERLGDNVGVIQHYYLSTAEVSTDCVGTPRFVKLDIPVKFDETNYKIERFYTEDKTFSKVYSLGDNSSKEIKFNGDTYKLSNDVVIQKEYTHNLGFVPIVICYNLPYTITQYNPQNILIRWKCETNTNYTNSLFKMYFQNDTAYADNICLEINETLESLFNEVIKSESAIVISGGNKQNFFDQNADLIDAKKREAYRKSGFIINVDDRNVEVDIKNNPNKLNEIYSLIESLMELYFNLSGLSFPKITGGNNKHTSEIKTMLLRTIETHKIKRRNINKWVGEIIYKSALMSGFKEEELDFTFRMNEQDLTNELEKAQALTMSVQGGIIDRLNAIKKYNDVPYEEAKEIKENVEKELKENVKQRNEQEGIKESTEQSDSTK